MSQFEFVAFVRQMSVMSRKTNTDYSQIRLLRSTYVINDAEVIHLSEYMCAPYIIRKNFQAVVSLYIIYLILLHT